MGAEEVDEYLGHLRSDYDMMVQHLAKISVHLDEAGRRLDARAIETLIQHWNLEPISGTPD